MSSPFVTAETIRLDLNEGRWVEVKARLSWGETQQLNAAALLTEPGPNGVPAVRLDLARHALARLEIWLVDWNFAGPSGKTVPVSPAAIASLDPIVAQEITAALDKHVEGLERGKVNGRNGSIPRSP